MVTGEAVMDRTLFPGGDPAGLSGEWTAERWFRSLLLPYGAAGRSASELRLCPHCDRTYFRSNGGACPRCGGSVGEESHQAVIFPFGIG